MMKKNKAWKAVICMTLAASALFTMGACGGTKEEPVKKRTHDQISHVIAGKTETTHHNFVDGKCKMCDETTIFRQEPMFKSPDILSKAQAKQGTLEYFWYKTRAYGVEERLSQNGSEHAGEELWIYKRAFIYLPNGYDANDTTKKYNVVYMMHGDKLNEGYWFHSGSYAPDEMSSVYTSGYGTENVMDYLSANSISEDTIYVSMTMYQYYDGEYSGDPANPNYYGGDLAVQANVYSGYVAPEDDLGFRTGWGTENEGLDVVYWKEWQYHLMPYVVDHYNTYAKSSSAEDMIAARDHVGFTGLSRGGASVNSVLANSLEYVSYFAFESSGTPSQASIDNIKAKANTYPVNYIFISCGSQEGPEGSDAGMLKARDQLGWSEGSDIKGGDKISFIQVNGTAHNYATWITNLYNFMLVAFKK